MVIAASDDLRVSSLELEADCDILEFLKNLSFPRFYWKSKDSSFEVIGSGVSKIFTDENAFEEAEEYLKVQGLQEPVCLGFKRFNHIKGDHQLWGELPDDGALMPSIAIVRSGNSFSLITDSTFDHEKLRQAVTKKISSGPAEYEFEPYEVEHIADLPSYDEWNVLIEEILDQIEEGNFEKVVPARITSLRAKDALSPIDILRGLREHSVSSYVFLLQADVETSFLCNSPESLISTHEDAVIADSIAGTAPLDEAGSLLGDEKLLREQKIVTDYLARKLNEVADKVARSEPDVLELPNVCHLYSMVFGKRKKGISLDDLVASIHPTPAVCGTPKEEVLSYIESKENFPRGLYAGAIGVIGSSFSDFSVGIRSALISGDTIHLFAGGGIIAGSEPASEWEELDNKLAIFDSVFKVKERASLRVVGS